MESPRWLVEKGRHQEAEAIVRRMQIISGAPRTPADEHFSYSELEGQNKSEKPLATLLKSRPLMTRLMLVLGFWFLFYLGFYGFNTYLPLFLEGAGVSITNAVFITALSRVSGILSGIAVLVLIERMERKTMIVGSVALITIGVLMVILGLGDGFATAGTLLLSFGTGTLTAPAYTYTAEVFPTAVRGTAASICDGIGHLGGAVAPFVILPLLINFGVLPAGIATIATLVLATILIAMGVRTKNRSLEEIGAVTS